MTEDALRGRIAYDGTRTPLKTALFLVVCLAWILPGLVGHDPWKVDEAEVFGTVTEIVRGGDWLVTRLAGETFLEKAPLYAWVSAGLATLLQGLLPLHDAARLASAIFMIATLGLISATSHELMGTRAIRMAVLLFIGCLGLLLRAHEMTSDLAGLSGIVLGLYGLALAQRRPALGGAVTGAGIGVAFLGDGFFGAATLLLTLAALPAAGTAWRTRQYALTALVASLVAAPLVAAWPLALAAHSPEALSFWLRNAEGSPWGDLFERGALGPLYYLRLLPWYAWPAWPLAAWALWRGRRHLLDRPSLLLPLVAFIAFFVAASVFGESREVNALPLLVPLAILGVAELDTLPRGAASALDWFGVTTFFLFAALIWLGWAGALTGKPEFAFAWIRREVPGFSYRFDFIAFALAALLTLIWLVVVARSLRSTRRAVVNWSAGITMVWMLVMTLGVPLVDQARSYRTVSSRLGSAIPVDGCVIRRNLGDAQRALIDYFANIRTVREDMPQSRNCTLLLVQASPSRVPPPGAGWSEIWRGSRPGDRNEAFVLYRRELGVQGQ